MSKFHTVFGASTPRTLGSTGSNSSSGSGETAEQKTSRWESKLRFVFLDGKEWARHVLEGVAHGFAPPAEECDAQRVFNDLLRHEAYEVFAEVFTAYSAIRKAQLLAEGESTFKAALTLRLPHDWSPRDPVGLRQVFRKIQVERVHVLRPTVDRERIAVWGPGIVSMLADELTSLVGRLTSTPPTQAQMEAQRKRDQAALYVPVSAAVCDCLAAVLEEGCTELVLGATLAAPAVVAHALAKSQLRSITLGEYYGLEAPVESYKALMPGLAACRTLEDFAIEQPALVVLGTDLAALAPEGSPLKTVRVRARGGLKFTPDTIDDITAFLKAVAGFKTLTEFSVQAEVRTLPFLNVFLEAFRAHTSLRQLDIVSTSGDPFGMDGLHVLGKLLAFSQTCPSLAHISVQSLWEHGDWGRTMAELLKTYVPDSDIDLPAIVSWLKDPNCPLRFLKVTGCPRDPVVVDALFDALGDNTSIEEIDLSDGSMHLPSGQKLIDALGRNPRLIRTAKLPMDPGNYYLIGPDGKCHVFWQARSGPSHDESGAFVPLIRKHASKAEMSAAGAAYRPFRELSKTVATAPQAVLDRRMHEAGIAELKLNLGYVLSQGGMLGAAKDAEDAMGLVLENQDAQFWRDTVRLSELNQGADRHKLRGGGKTPDNLRKVVKAKNQEAVDGGLTSAPRKVNAVNAQRVNIALSVAAKDNDAKRVRLLRQQDRAIDFRGLAEREARSSAVASAFREPLKSTPTAAAGVTASDTNANANAKAPPSVSNDT